MQMWGYRKPRFELLLLGELQRQQRGSLLCDTVLQAEGISVPAHSCVLSAFSPHFSHMFSTAPALSTGQNHLIEFQSLGAQTLLKLVRFFYSGELEGEGERERQDVIAATCKLGIDGLVEVSGGGDGGGHKDDGQVEASERRDVVSVEPWSRREVKKQREAITRKETGMQTEAQEDGQGEPGTGGNGGSMSMALLKTVRQIELQRTKDTWTSIVTNTGTPQASSDAILQCPEWAAPLVNVSPRTGCSSCSVICCSRDEAATSSLSKMDGETSSATTDSDARTLSDDVAPPTGSNASLAVPVKSGVVATVGLRPVSACAALAPPANAGDAGVVAADLQSFDNAGRVASSVGESATVLSLAPHSDHAQSMLDLATFAVPAVVSLVPPGPWIPLLHFKLLPSASPALLSIPQSTNPRGPGSIVLEDAGEFRRFEGNVAGFINYFMNEKPSPEGSLPAWAEKGSGRGRVIGRVSKHRGRRRRGRKQEAARGERSSDETRAEECRKPEPWVDREWELGKPKRVFGAGVQRGRRGRGGGVVGSWSNIRAKLREGKQSFKFKFKRQSTEKSWEIVHSEEAFVTVARARGRGQRRRRGAEHPRSQVTRKNQEVSQDDVPILKRPRGRPRTRPIPFPSLSRDTLRALKVTPPSNRASLAPLSPARSHSSSQDPSHHPRVALAPAGLRPLPPLPPSASPEDSVEQIDKLLEDIMMGLDFLPTAAEGGQGDGTSGGPCCLHNNPSARLCGTEATASSSYPCLHSSIGQALDPHVITETFHSGDGAIMASVIDSPGLSLTVSQSSASPPFIALSTVPLAVCTATPDPLIESPRGYPPTLNRLSHQPRSPSVNSHHPWNSEGQSCQSGQVEEDNLCRADVRPTGPRIWSGYSSEPDLRLASEPVDQCPCDLMAGGAECSCLPSKESASVGVSVSSYTAGTKCSRHVVGSTRETEDVALSIGARGPTNLSETPTASVHLFSGPYPGPADLRVPQQTTGELNDILDHFLQSFEGHSALRCSESGDRHWQNCAGEKGAVHEGGKLTGRPDDLHGLSGDTGGSGGLPNVVSTTGASINEMDAHRHNVNKPCPNESRKTRAMNSVGLAASAREHNRLDPPVRSAAETVATSRPGTDVNTRLWSPHNPQFSSSCTTAVKGPVCVGSNLQSAECSTASPWRQMQLPELVSPLHSEELQSPAEPVVEARPLQGCPSPLQREGGVRVQVAQTPLESRRTPHLKLCSSLIAQSEQRSLGQLQNWLSPLPRGPQFPLSSNSRMKHMSTASTHSGQQSLLHLCTVRMQSITSSATQGSEVVCELEGQESREEVSDQTRKIMTRRQTREWKKAEEDRKQKDSASSHRSVKRQLKSQIQIQEACNVRFSTRRVNQEVTRSGEENMDRLSLEKPGRIGRLKGGRRTGKTRAPKDTSRKAKITGNGVGMLRVGVTVTSCDKFNSSNCVVKMINCAQRPGKPVDGPEKRKLDTCAVMLGKVQGCVSRLAKARASQRAHASDCRAGLTKTDPLPRRAQGRSRKKRCKRAGSIPKAREAKGPSMEPFATPTECRRSLCAIQEPLSRRVRREKEKEAFRKQAEPLQRGMKRRRKDEEKEKRHVRPRATWEADGEGNTNGYGRGEVGERTRRGKAGIDQTDKEAVESRRGEMEPGEQAGSRRLEGEPKRNEKNKPVCSPTCADINKAGQEIEKDVEGRKVKEQQNFAELHEKVTPSALHHLLGKLEPEEEEEVEEDVEVDVLECSSPTSAPLNMLLGSTGEGLQLWTSSETEDEDVEVEIDVIGETTE